jgi:nucleotide-binding universal stress UspA family protein
MTTLLTEKPLELHVWEEALQLRDSGGRAIASLFPLDVQRGIQAEWVASWMDSMERPVFALRFAADEEQREQILDAAEELAESLQANKPAAKIAVTPPASRASSAKPRRLKEFQAGVDKVTVHVGSPQPPSPPPSNSSPLAARPPSSGGSSSHASTGPAPVEYSTADLEQRGWEILVHALNTSIRPELQDFRRRRGVGADGAIDWKTFVELKASGRSMPSSIQMTNAEYERAQERGADFILALVYGLEQDERTEARLIFDPAKTLTLRPVNGVRLVGLTEATSVVLTFSE